MASEFLNKILLFTKNIHLISILQKIFSEELVFYKNMPQSLKLKNCIVIYDFKIDNENKLNAILINCYEIFLTNKMELYEKQNAYCSHFKKPISINKLLSLIIDKKNVLNNFVQEYIIGIYKFNYNENIVIHKDRVIKLTEKESNLLKYLYQNGQSSKEEILANIWGYASNADTNTIDTHKYTIKKKLNDNLIIFKDGLYSLKF